MMSWGECGLSTSTTMRSAGWDEDELAILQHAAKLLEQSGVVAEIGWDMSDEADPWFSVTDPFTDDVLLHITCLNWSFIALSDAISRPLRGGDLYMVATEAVSRVIRLRTTTDRMPDTAADGMLQQRRNIPRLTQKSIRIK